MRLRDGNWECIHCGAQLDVLHGVQPEVLIHSSSAKPTERVLSVDGREIHRCALGSNGHLSDSLCTP